MLQRVKKQNSQQFITPLRGVRHNYFFLILLFGWFWLLFALASDSMWHLENVLWLAGTTLVVALLIGGNLSWILRWHRSPFKSFLIVSPLYFIKTHLDEVQFWPLWDLKDVRATHNYRNGFFTGTDVTFVFSSGTENLTFTRKSAFDSMLAAVRSFDAKCRTAKQHGQLDYFYHEDDFREVERSEAPIVSKRPRPATLVIFGMVILFCGALFAVAWHMSSLLGSNSTPSRYVQVPSIPVSTPVPRPTLPPIPAFSASAMPLPPSGEVRRYTTQAGVAPLQIRSSPGSNYLVKLEDASTRRFVMSVFVRGGNTEEIEVPLGTYVVKYASGEVWYGYRKLFGLSTDYIKADRLFSFTLSDNQYRGYTITLYKVRDGNLSTSRLSPDQF